MQTTRNRALTALAGELELGLELELELTPAVKFPRLLAAAKLMRGLLNSQMVYKCTTCASHRVEA